MSEAMVEVATVKQCWRYPVKSFQGEQTSHLVLGPDGIEGDRSFGLIDQATGHLLSAKAVRQLLEARATIDTVVLPDGTNQPIDDPSTDLVLSQWLGRAVRLARPIDSGPVSYQMTFGPAGPDRRTVDVPTPSGTFLDVAHVHLLTTASLAAGRAARPDLDWDVRRFRPNLVLEVDAKVSSKTPGSGIACESATASWFPMTAHCAAPCPCAPNMVWTAPPISSGPWST
jgi:uncharacterized protein YcbX